MHMSVSSHFICIKESQLVFPVELNDLHDLLVTKSNVSKELIYNERSKHLFYFSHFL